MERTPVSYRKRLKALTNPRPEFVSLVKTGANMTPFLAIKSEDTPLTDVQMAVKSDTHDIVKITFDSDQFANEGQVTDWLNHGGYDNYEVKKSDEGFSVTGEGEVPPEDAIAIPAGVGITMYASKRAKETVKATQTPIEVAEVAAAAVTDTTVVKKSAVPVVSLPSMLDVRKKFDDWAVGYSGAKSMQDALAAGFDGMPPGICELTNAMYGAMQNACYAGDLNSIRAIGVDYGNIVAELVNMFPDVNDMRAQALAVMMPDATISYTKGSGDSELQTTVEIIVSKVEENNTATPVVTEVAAEKVAAATAVEAVVAEKTDGVMGSNPGNANQAAPVAAAPGASGTVSGAIGIMGSGGAGTGLSNDGAAPAINSGGANDNAANQAIDNGTPTAGIQELRDVISNLTSLIGGLNTSLNGVQTAQKAAEEATLAAVARVEALENERQSRKGADVTDDAAGKTSQKADVTKEMAQVRFRSVMGMAPDPRK